MKPGPIYVQHHEFVQNAGQYMALASIKTPVYVVGPAGEVLMTLLGPCSQWNWEEE